MPTNANTIERKQQIKNMKSKFKSMLSLCVSLCTQTACYSECNFSPQTSLTPYNCISCCFVYLNIQDCVMAAFNVHLYGLVALQSRSRWPWHDGLCLSSHTRTDFGFRAVAALPEWLESPRKGQEVRNLPNSVFFCWHKWFSPVVFAMQLAVTALS